MRSVNVLASIPNADIDQVFQRLSDFADYPKYTDAVREVTITATTDGAIESTWSVNFRNGVLCWIERDTLDPVAHRIEFEQLTGDFDVFAGQWRLETVESGVLVSLHAEFDLGLPTIAAMIEPIAEQALLENMDKVLRGLFGDDVTISNDQRSEPAADSPLSTTAVH